MKVLILNGSPKENGNTAIALNEMIRIFQKEAVAKETDGSETMEYPAKWIIKDGKLLFLVDTNTFSIAYNEEGGTESLLLYDDSDQLRGIFTPSDKE